MCGCWRAGWGVCHDNLVRRLFLQAMSALLRGYHAFLTGESACALGVCMWRTRGWGWSAGMVDYGTQGCVGRG